MQVHLLKDLITNTELSTAVDAEDTAMLQALYSRSKKSVTEHIEKLKSAGSSSFMEKYYINYNHASVGDMGTVTLFIENVSMIAAKQLQDTALYSGTECSSRYIDFETDYIDDSVFLPKAMEYDLAATDIVDGFSELYTKVKVGMHEHLLSTETKPEGIDNSVWDKTLTARAFDVARGFIVAGARTNLSVHMSLRELLSRYTDLTVNPNEEVRAVNDLILKILQKAYPSSFKVRELNPDQFDWYEALQYENAHGYTGKDLSLDLTVEDSFPPIYPNFASLAISRPKYTKLPRAFRRLGYINYSDVIDFGGIRDLHRHRPAYIPLPVVNGTLGFNNWYIDMLPDTIREEIKDSVETLFTLMETAPYSETDMQYVYPLGTNVPFNLCCDIPQAVYMVELRSGQTVHPTVRGVIHRLIDKMEHHYPALTLYVDRDPSKLDPKRGTQDIIEK